MSNNYASLLGPRGFLSNFPPDVVAVVNGQPITKADLLATKHRIQRRRLANKRTCWEPVIKPCFVWVFRVESFAYYGWHLYIKTLHKEWWISRGQPLGPHSKACVKAMQMFPCGYLPMIENLRYWMPAFAEAHHWPTRKRPQHQGLALARVKYDPFSGQLIELLDVEKSLERI